MSEALGEDAKALVAHIVKVWLNYEKVSSGKVSGILGRKLQANFNTRAAILSG